MPRLRSRLLRLLLAASAGVLFALSFPSAAIGWLMFVAFVPLLVAVARAGGGWEAFFLGWLWQGVAWLLMAPWVVRVMSHYGGLPYALGVAVFVAMALYLGLYGGAFAVVVYRLRLGERFGPWLLIAPAWAAVELARTYLFTGFPWNLIATALVDATSLIQIDRFAGPYFTGSLILVPSIVAAWLLVRRPPFGVGVAAALTTATFLFVWWATGYVGARLIRRPGPEPVATAALLQPNISQEMRWNTQNLFDIYGRMMAMTRQAMERGAQVVIWPESTVPLSYGATDFFRSSIEQLSAEHHADILLGSVAEDPESPTRLWNSAFLASDGRTVGHYDKIRLVPFGEYVPLRKFLFFARKLVHEVGEFQFGTNDFPLRGRFAYGPAICYEIVYPQIARQQVRHGATVLVTITNDAWYDGTSAPAQHLWQARLRAVESNRWLLRAATTGISALIDPTGRVVQQLPMGREGIIYAQFQPRQGATPYVRCGDWFAWSACALSAAALFLRNRSPKTDDERR